jgi:hypothetical protein
LEARHGEGAVVVPPANPSAVSDARSGRSKRTAVYEGTTRTTREPSGMTFRICPRG